MKGLIVVYVLFLVLFISRGLFLGLKCLVARRQCPRERGRERMEKAREWRREIVCVVKAELQTRSRTESALTHARTHTDTHCACCLFFFIIFITPCCEMFVCRLAWLSLKVCNSHQIWFKWEESDKCYSADALSKSVPHTHTHTHACTHIYRKQRCCCGAEQLLTSCTAMVTHSRKHPVIRTYTHTCTRTQTHFTLTL